MDIKPSSRINGPQRPLRKPDAVIDEAVEDEVDTKKNRWYRRIGWWWIVIALGVVLMAGLGVWWYLGQKKATTVDVHKAVLPPKPKTVENPLTGAQVSAADAAMPAVGIMIENLDPNARPQSGLGQAGIVYEALAEGGITRFLAIFQQPYPTTIGPVRSLRPYYLDWDQEYQTPIAHAGGSMPALAALPLSGAEDINALLYDGSYFYRAADRAAPHNFYTNNILLPQLQLKLGFNKPLSVQGRPRKTDQPASGVVAHPTININFSYSDYAVEYKYDGPSDSYARWMAGTTHVDRNTNKQIMVKNVIVEYIPVSYSTQGNGDPQTNYADIGSGKALVFMDGNVTTATWTKTSATSQTQIADASGNPIKLNVGNTWFEMVPTTNQVTY